MSYGSPITYPSNPNPATDFAALDAIDIMGRLINGEAAGESYTGKVGVAYVIKNRYNKNLSGFGNKNEKAIMLKDKQFLGLTNKNLAYQPDISSQSWKDSIFIAQDYFHNGLRYDNPIGKCLWFNKKSAYNNVSGLINGKEYYWGFGTGNKLVVEKVVLGNHVFFRVEGY